MPLRLIHCLFLAMLFGGCTPTDTDGRPVKPHPSDATSATPARAALPAAESPAATSFNGPYHGNWRLMAADDPHDAALMAFWIQSDAGARQGNGNFVLFQPFCDAVTDAPIVGNTECELIGLGAVFEHVDIARDRVVLVFQPTADGLPHRLELRIDGDALAGDYVAGANGIRRAVIARRPPAGAP